MSTPWLTAGPGLTLFLHTAEPGSKSEPALNLLSSLTAAAEQADAAHVTD